MFRESFQREITRAELLQFRIYTSERRVVANLDEAKVRQENTEMFRPFASLTDLKNTVFVTANFCFNRRVKCNQ